MFQLIYDDLMYTRHCFDGKSPEREKESERRRKLRRRVRASACMHECVCVWWLSACAIACVWLCARLYERVNASKSFIASVHESEPLGLCVCASEREMVVEY